MCFFQNQVMEQQLINAFMKLLAKAGGGSLIKDLIQKVDENGNPKVWSPSELAKATDYVNWQIENFGTAEASAVIETLVRKYNLRPQDLLTADEPMPDTPGVKGLQ
jgi:hypothetical protein